MKSIFWFSLIVFIGNTHAKTFGPIQGVLLDKFHRPLANVPVEIKHSEYSRTSPADQTQMSYTDESGHFHFNKISYTAELLRNEWLSLSFFNLTERSIPLSRDRKKITENYMNFLNRNNTYVFLNEILPLELKNIPEEIRLSVRDENFIVRGNVQVFQKNILTVGHDQDQAFGENRILWSKQGDPINLLNSNEKIKIQQVFNNLHNEGPLYLKIDFRSEDTNDGGFGNNAHTTHLPRVRVNVVISDFHKKNWSMVLGKLSQSWRRGTSNEDFDYVLEYQE